MHRTRTRTDWTARSMTGLTEHDLVVERRLTTMEMFARHQLEVNTKMDKRLTLQERGLLLLIGALNVLAHDKIPELAKASATWLLKLASPPGA